VNQAVRRRVTLCSRPRYQTGTGVVLGMLARGGRRLSLRSELMACHSLGGRRCCSLPVSFEPIVIALNDSLYQKFDVAALTYRREL
jgi:hypothetical protein